MSNRDYHIEKSGTRTTTLGHEGFSITLNGKIFIIRQVFTIPIFFKEVMRSFLTSKGAFSEDRLNDLSERLHILVAEEIVNYTKKFPLNIEIDESREIDLYDIGVSIDEYEFSLDLSLIVEDLSSYPLAVHIVGASLS